MNHDPELKQVLQAWDYSPPPSAEFSTSVWRRIAAEDEKRFVFARALRKWLLVELPRPAYVSALLMLAILGGAALGTMRAERQRDHDRLAMARRYLSSIDPLEMMSSPHNP